MADDVTRLDLAAWLREIAGYAAGINERGCAALAVAAAQLEADHRALAPRPAAGATLGETLVDVKRVIRERLFRTEQFSLRYTRGRLCIRDGDSIGPDINIEILAEQIALDLRDAALRAAPPSEDAELRAAYEQAERRDVNRKANEQDKHKEDPK